MSYVVLILEALLVVLAAIVFKVLNYKTKFKNLSYWLKQAIYAVSFALIAIAATEISSAIDGLNNTRDAGPIVAGFFFGAPAGIAAGIIAGLERLITGFYISTRMYTNIACSVATMLAGCLAALLRVTTKKGRKIHVVTACTLALVIEIIHMLLIYLTHMDDLARVIGIYRTVVGPMTIANFLAVLLAGVSDLLLDRYFNHEKLFIKLKDSQMSGAIQQTTLIIAALVFVAGFLSINSIQDRISLENIESILSSQSQNASEKGKSLVNYSLGDYASRVSKIYEYDSSNFQAAYNDFNPEDSQTQKRPYCCEGYVIEGKYNSDGTFKGKIIENYKEEGRLATQEDVDDDHNAVLANIIENKLVPNHRMTDFNVTDGFVSSIEEGKNKEVVYSVADVTEKEDHGDDTRLYFALAMDVEQGSNCVKKQATFILDNQTYETGSTALLDYYNHKLIAASTGSEKRIQITDEDLSQIKQIPENAGVVTKVNIQGADFYGVAYMDPSIGMYCYSVVTVDEAELPARVSKYSSSFLFIINVGVIFLVANALIDRLVVRKMEDVGEALDKITGNDLDVEVNVHGFEEFNKLSDGINHTVGRLKGYMIEEKKRMTRDLDFAKSIQKSALPYVFPTTPIYDLFADMKTAKQVGGDFYDFFPLNNDRLFFLIADVSGKGVPAALFMMRAESVIKSLVQADELSLDKIVSRVNNELCSNNDAQMFVTAWCGIINLKTGHIDFVNAGHNLPLIKRKGGEFQEVRVIKNFVLAGMPDIVFRAESIDLNPGDEIFIYTDGVTEATDKNKQLYGMQRLLDFMNNSNYKSSKELIDQLNVELNNFQKDVDQADDITMLMLRYKPND